MSLVIVVGNTLASGAGNTLPALPSPGYAMLLGYGVAQLFRLVDRSFQKVGVWQAVVHIQHQIGLVLRHTRSDFWLWETESPMNLRHPRCLLSVVLQSIAAANQGCS